MTGRKTPIPGFTLDKSGKLVRNKKALPVHKKIASRTTKRVVTRAQAINARSKKGD